MSESYIYNRLVHEGFWACRCWHAKILVRHPKKNVTCYATCCKISDTLSLIAICESLAKTASGSIVQPNTDFTPHNVPVQCPIKVALNFWHVNSFRRLGWHATVHGRLTPAEHASQQCEQSSNTRTHVDVCIHNMYAAHFEYRLACIAHCTGSCCAMQSLHRA